MDNVIHLETLDPAHAQRELFVRFFDYMDTAHPRIPVRDEVVDELQSVRADILNGNPLCAEIGLWGIIFTGVRWDAFGSSRGRRIGASLLLFAGLLGEMLKEQGSTYVPITRALMAMAMVKLLPNPSLVVRFEQDDGGRWYLRVTPLGITELGLSGKVALNEPVPVCDSVTQLFEEFYDLQARFRRPLNSGWTEAEYLRS